MNGYPLFIRDSISKVKQGQPGIIFIPGYLNEITKLLKQARELGIKAKFITISTAFDEKLFELAGIAAEGLFMSAPFYSQETESPEVVMFRDSYRRKYGAVPNVWAAYGYDVLRIASIALETSEKNRTELKNELLKIRDYRGVTGNTTFLPNGGVEKELRIVIVQKGKFALVK